MAKRPKNPVPPRKLDLGETVDELIGSAPGPVPGTEGPRPGGPIWQRIFRHGGRTAALWIILASLGPGLVAANAGNDAGGIATYSSVGAEFGYSLLWMFPLILISLAVVQEMAARMGAATGKGLSDLIRENFPIHATAIVLLALLVANGGTIVSEFVGIAAAVDLIRPGSQYVLVPLIAVGIWLVVVRGSYRGVERIFLAMTLVFFAYPISAILAHPDWGQAARQMVHPTFHFDNPSYLTLFVATVGTSITPYMQVYIQSAVADRGITARDYTPQRIEVYLASVFANVIAIFIVIATAATLFVHHQTVQTAADAAKALRPFAGAYAEYLFAVGLFGASMLAAAVLPLATAYAITEALGVEKGIDAGFREAPVFMGLFSGLMAVGVVVALVIPSHALIQALIVVQVIDALLLPVILFAILRLINNYQLMGDMVNGPIYNLIARVTAIAVTILALMYVLSTFGVRL